ncbi:MAG: hypothetical protein HC848_11075 [Limnobacter sp.]|nr:hypothetical protein [Limnobacter sp.]
MLKWEPRWNPDPNFGNNLRKEFDKIGPDIVEFYLDQTARMRGSTAPTEEQKIACGEAADILKTTLIENAREEITDLINSSQNSGQDPLQAPAVAASVPGHNQAAEIDSILGSYAAVLDTFIGGNINTVDAQNGQNKRVFVPGALQLAQGVAEALRKVGFARVR